MLTSKSAVVLMASSLATTIFALLNISDKSVRPLGKLNDGSLICTMLLLSVPIEEATEVMRIYYMAKYFMLECVLNDDNWLVNSGSHFCLVSADANGAVLYENSAQFHEGFHVITRLHEKRFNMFQSRMRKLFACGFCVVGFMGFNADVDDNSVCILVVVGGEAKYRLYTLTEEEFKRYISHRANMVVGNLGSFKNKYRWI